MKKLRKAFTLIELTVAMSLSIVVLAAGTVIFFSFNKFYEASKKEINFLNEFRTLSLAFDKALNIGSDGKIEIEEKSIDQEEAIKVFTISSNEGSLEYFYDTKTFSCVNENGETTQIAINSNNIFLYISKENEGCIYKFTFVNSEDLNVETELIRAIVNDQN